MHTLKITHLLPLVESGYLLQKGDIVFVFTPCHSGSPISFIIKGTQKMFGSGEDIFPYDDMDAHTATHTGIVVANPVSRNKTQLMIAESDPPETRIVSIENFFFKHPNKQFIIFRSTICGFSPIFASHALQFASQKIPYFSPLDNLRSAFSQKSKTPPISLPRTFNCSSFISFTHDFTCFYSHFPMLPFGFSKVSPDSLYGHLRRREETHHTWRRVAKITSV